MAILLFGLVLPSGIPVAVRGQVASLEATFSLTTIDSVTIPFQNGFPVPSFEKQSRPALSLCGSWRKQRFSANHDLSLSIRNAAGYAALLTEAAGRSSPSYDDSAWPAKTLPGVENTMNLYETTPEYYENGVWYRRTFNVPDSLQGKSAILKFLSVNYVADVWLNGTYLGWHEGGYTPFAFDVTSFLRTDTINVIAVRVDNIPWNPGQDASTGRIDIVPYYRVDWFNYTGVMHDVYIEFADPVSVLRADVVPLNTQGNVRATVVLRNGGATGRNVDVALNVFRASVDSANIATEYPGELIGDPATLAGTPQQVLTVPPDSFGIWRTTITVVSPKLWSPRSPNLYILRVTVSDSGKILDTFATQFGIRTIRTSGSTFLLNGRAIFLPGVARHEDHPLFGRSLPTPVIVDDLRKVKSLNVSFVRTAHYPNNPFTYLIADRLGLAVMEEIPVWWFDTDQAWSIQNTSRHIHTQMWREMVFKDYNRPSVILWSTCNECLAVSGRTAFIAAVNVELDTKYPDGRLVTQSAAADRPGANDVSQQACDAAGWTMYFGIFHGGTYYDGTRQFLQSAHAAQPYKPIVNTEFGYWSTESGSTEGQQVEVFDSTFRALSEVTILDRDGTPNPNGFLMGTMWWCAFDWYTAQQPAGFQSMGIYHMDRTTPKQVTPVLINAYAPYYQNSEIDGVEKERQGTPPAGFSLEQNYPNPFNPATRVSFRIAAAGPVTLKVYDVLGRELATLVNEVKSRGTHQVVWDAKALASGVYFCRLVAGNFSETRRMLLLR